MLVNPEYITEDMISMINIALDHDIPAYESRNGGIFPYINNEQHIDFRYRLKFLRLAYGYTQKELGSHYDKTEGAIRAWESGKSKPDIDILIKLANEFNCTTDYLLGLSNNKNKNSN